MNLAVLYFGYAAAVLLVARLAMKHQPPGKKGLLLYLGILSVIFPVAGLAFSLWAWHSRDKKTGQEDWFEEYERYVHYKADNLTRLRVRATSDLELIPVASALRYKENKIHKRLISEMGESPMGKRGQLLKEAVRHEDYETAHYAATMLNTFQSRFEQRVRMLTAGLSGDPTTYVRLAETYADHIESGFVTDNQEQELIGAYRSLLEEAAGRFPQQPEFARLEADQLVRDGKVEQAFLVYQSLLGAHQAYAPAYEGAIRCLYEMKDWTSLYQIVELADERGIGLSDRYRQFVKGVS
ncbi:hypothetical protein ACFFIY_08395 [Bhargavaea ullalensis]|uniref:Uncharacterized protein n=1 Tax=Bhargavaea ullalensis TaxID=1265685 RepID=A0ABV2GEB0_9BACL